MTASKHTKESGLTSYNLELGNVELQRLKEYLNKLCRGNTSVYGFERYEVEHFIKTIEKIQE